MTTRRHRRRLPPCTALALICWAGPNWAAIECSMTTTSVGAFYNAAANTDVTGSAVLTCTRLSTDPTTRLGQLLRTARIPGERRDEVIGQILDLDRQEGASPHMKGHVCHTYTLINDRSHEFRREMQSCRGGGHSPFPFPINCLIILTVCRVNVPFTGNIRR